MLLRHAVLVVVAIALVVTAGRLDVVERLWAWSRPLESWELDELLVLTIVSIGLWLGISRRRRIDREVRRYRRLFETSPLLLREVDISGVLERIDQLRQSGVEDMDAWLREHPEEVATCSARARDLRINRAVIGFYGARDEGELAARIDETMTPRHLRRRREQIVAFAGGRLPERYETTVRTLRGERRIVDVQVSLLEERKGRPHVLLYAIVDVTEQRRTAALLSDSAERLERAVQGAELGFWEWNVRTSRVIHDPDWGSWSGSAAAAGDRRAVPWRELVHPEDLPAVMHRLRAHVRGETTRYESEHRIRTAEGGWRWVLGRGRIVERNESRPRRMSGTHLDITERRLAEDRRRRLVEELDHRVKNTLAGVLSLVDQSRLRSQTIDQFAATLRQRVASLARVHEALAASRWSGVQLDEIVNIAVAPYAGGSEHRVTVAGEKVRLPARAAAPMCMSLHELTTNAAKYGALSGPGGRLDIRWIREGDAVRLSWQERGGRGPASAIESGTGLRLVRGFVEHELGGRVTLEFDREGVDCEMRIPLEAA